MPRLGVSAELGGSQPQPGYLQPRCGAVPGPPAGPPPPPRPPRAPPHPTPGGGAAAGCGDLPTVPRCAALRPVPGSGRRLGPSASGSAPKRCSCGGGGDTGTRGAWPVEVGVDTPLGVWAGRASCCCCPGTSETGKKIGAVRGGGVSGRRGTLSVRGGLQPGLRGFQVFWAKRGGRPSPFPLGPRHSYCLICDRKHTVGNSALICFFRSAGKRLPWPCTS